MAQVKNEATIIQAIAGRYMNMEIRSEILIVPTKWETQIETREERDNSPKSPKSRKVRNPRNSGCAIIYDINM